MLGHNSPLQNLDHDMRDILPSIDAGNLLLFVRCQLAARELVSEQRLAIIMGNRNAHWRN